MSRRWKFELFTRRPPLLADEGQLASEQTSGPMYWYGLLVASTFEKQAAALNKSDTTISSQTSAASALEARTSPLVRREGEVKVKKIENHHEKYDAGVRSLCADPGGLGQRVAH